MDGQYWIEDPEIEEVQDLDSGAVISSAEAIGTNYDAVMALRLELAHARAEGKPRYVCPLCGVPVYLVRRKEAQRFFFRHELEDGRCSAHTRGELDEREINARKYNGAKESQAHLRMKQIIAKSLACDPRFSRPEIEKVVLGKGATRGTWRKPDVMATFEGIPVAFEIQLSTTFLRVIAERRRFYLENGGLLVWVFKKFEATHPKMTQDDVFHSNNHNLFLASEETLAESCRTGRMMLDCKWAEPYLEGKSIETRWGGRRVAFDELTIDREQQRVFLFDYERAAKAIELETDAAKLRWAFEQFWLPRASTGEYDKLTWAHLRTGFRKRGIPLPPEPYTGPAPLLYALYSAREGQPIGWQFHNLVEVAHRVAGGYPRFLRLFLHAVSFYMRVDQIRAEDKSGKWRKVAQKFKPLLRSHDPSYSHDPTYDQLVAFLFPELQRRRGQ